MPERKSLVKGIQVSISSILKHFVLTLIRIYRVNISPFKPQVCRFYPTCSKYMYEAVERYGVLKGLAMGLTRISKCHPFNPGGYNPVK